MIWQDIFEYSLPKMAIRLKWFEDQLRVRFVRENCTFRKGNSRQMLTGKTKTNSLRACVIGIGTLY